MAKNRNSRAKSKTPAAVAQVVAPQPEATVALVTAPPVVREAAPPVLREAAPPVVREAAPMAKAAPKKPSHEEIARRAYELWLRRGAPLGSHLEDWLSAERELTAA